MLSRKIIKSDAFAYGQNKEVDAKYFVEPENVNKVKLLVIEVQQTIKYHNLSKKSPLHELCTQ